MHRLTVLAVVLAVMTGVASASTSTTTSVTITTPKPGQSISLKRNPYLAVAGTVTFAAANPSSTRFYLRRDDCGGSNDNPHLSVVNGTDAGDGCGLLVSSIVGVGGTVDSGAFVDFPTTDGMPLTFDSSHNVTGTIDLQNFGLVSPLSAGVGLLTVDVTMEALDHGDGVPIGSDSETVLITPTPTDYPVSFTIQPNAALDKADLSGIDLRVHVGGPFVFSGFIGNSGKSFTDIPSYTASVTQSVQISLDDATFGSALAGRIGASNTTWSVAVPTPVVGKHTLYARSTQGFDTSPTVSENFNVTK